MFAIKMTKYFMTLKYTLYTLNSFRVLFVLKSLLLLTALFHIYVIFL